MLLSFGEIFECFLQPRVLNMIVIILGFRALIGIVKRVSLRALFVLRVLSDWPSKFPRQDSWKANSSIAAVALWSPWILEERCSSNTYLARASHPDRPFDSNKFPAFSATVRTYEVLDKHINTKLISSKTNNTLQTSKEVWSLCGVQFSWPGANGCAASVNNSW